ncbi:hypothetical protein F8M41_010553 [Gigaspora margarita]|uniref:Uncharacterized protein n=1 Tax=Gigaspora margarita TaxID=4874 RepID=A0A8H4A173_GIGMA|nr:hypothetical protein F8M41_010553 [Gigaspora margarita]
MSLNTPPIYFQKEGTRKTTLARDRIQRKHDDEKIEVNSTEFQQNKNLPKSTNGITLVTKEIDELSTRKCQRGEEPQIPKKIRNLLINTTIHLVKETIEELVYEKVRNMLQMGNKLVMNDLIVKRLENLFQASYSEIESKIISETNIGDNQTTEENRFIFFIRCALPDFVFM